MRMRITLAIWSILICAGAGPSWSMDLKLGTEAYGSFNRYSMSGFNDDVVDVLNSTGAFDLQPITNGITGGIGLRARVGRRFMASAIWEPLFADSRTVFYGQDSTGTQADGSLRFNFDVSTYSVGGAYFFTDQNLGWLGLGAALAYYQVTGEVNATLHAPGVAVDEAAGNYVAGSTVGIHVSAHGEWQAAPRLAVTSALGYRYAKVTNAHEQTVDGDQPLGDLDYSGMFVRVGVAFYLTGIHAGVAPATTPTEH